MYIDTFLHQNLSRIEVLILLNTQLIVSLTLKAYFKLITSTYTYLGIILMIWQNTSKSYLHGCHFDMSNLGLSPIYIYYIL